LDHVDLLKMRLKGGDYEAPLYTPPDGLLLIRRIALDYHGHTAPYAKQQIFDHLYKAGFKGTSDIHNSRGYGVAEAVTTHSATTSMYPRSLTASARNLCFYSGISQIA
jgi:hypothetical protein